MTFEEELKHVATYSNIYEILWDGPKKFDVAKQYLMREFGKPESTARSYITSIRNGNTGLMMVDEVAGTIALDKEKVCELEDSLEYLFVWNEYDNRHREFEEFKENAQKELKWSEDLHMNLQAELNDNKFRHKCKLVEYKKKVTELEEQLQETSDKLETTERELEKFKNAPLVESLIHRIKVKIHCWEQKRKAGEC